ncbi:protein FAR1-RELATED SEQUENCE 12-like [Cornus florida]|uniref:protein FAR1-RELATED SEQUENCE 12-like n=1 Tax=Cornus florida TaxID=4283 RepID=UPI002898858F|nr:protein FAR1-RELATED SEQUENCE 12-like [Cornus florida]
MEGEVNNIQNTINGQNVPVIEPEVIKWKPRYETDFDSEEQAYDFYNAYGGGIGFSIRKEYGNKVSGRITSRALVCSNHMMPSQRRISLVQAIDVELDLDSGVPTCNAYELMGRQFSGKESVGYLKVDLKNYLRT